MKRQLLLLGGFLIAGNILFYLKPASAEQSNQLAVINLSEEFKKPNLNLEEKISRFILGNEGHDLETTLSNLIEDIVNNRGFFKGIIYTEAYPAIRNALKKASDTSPSLKEKIKNLKEHYLSTISLELIDSGDEKLTGPLYRLQFLMTERVADIKPSF